MATHAVEHMIYNPIAHKKGNWTVTQYYNSDNDHTFYEGSLMLKVKKKSYGISVSRNTRLDNPWILFPIFPGFGMLIDLS